MCLLPLQSLSQVTHPPMLMGSKKRTLLEGDLCEKIPSFRSNSFESHFFQSRRKDMIKTQDQVASVSKLISELFISKVEKKEFASLCGSYVSQVNEVNPYLLKYHLEGMQKGWIVSVGGLRCMFDALLAPDDRFEGICIVDQDSDVVYAHRGLVLLFVISKDATDARDLLPLFKNNPQKILERVEICQDLSDSQKKYYKENLHILVGPLEELLSSQCEFDAQKYAVKSCNEVAFPEIIKKMEPLFFMHVQESFAKLQRYAKEGKICAVTGNIYDLNFLKELPVAVVDESNCHQYLPDREDLDSFLYTCMIRPKTINPILRISTLGAGAETVFGSLYDYIDQISLKTLSLQDHRVNGPIGYMRGPCHFNFFYAGDDIETPLSVDEFDMVKEAKFFEYERKQEGFSHDLNF